MVPYKHPRGIQGRTGCKDELSGRYMVHVCEFIHCITHGINTDKDIELHKHYSYIIYTLLIDLIYSYLIF